VVLIEFGFLWMYRVGWPISSGGLSVNILATIVLALVGWFVFRDRLSPTNLIGMIVCLVGLALLTYRSH
jgi:multidrug transporter EmrE-like cation transporter